MAYAHAMRLAAAHAVLLVGLGMLAVPQAFAQGDPCAIETGSFAGVTRDPPKRSSTLSVVPQSPCPTLETGSAAWLGRIDVEVPVDRHGQRDSGRE
jgi:hypothetical protein